MWKTSELPALLKKIDNYDASHFVRLALKLMVHVFLRTNELIAAQWSELDRSKKIWNVPAERMKLRRPHIVPLSRQVLVLFDELWERRKNDVWIFPGERDNLYMNRNSMLCALKRMGYKGTMTGHGFRGLATTLLRERGYDKDLVEMQLSHALANKVEEAYNKARYLPQRRVMMQDWSDFLDEIRKSGKVDPLPGRRVKEAADNNERVAVLNLELGLERGVVSASTGAPGFRNGAS